MAISKDRVNINNNGETKCKSTPIFDKGRFPRLDGGMGCLFFISYLISLYSSSLSQRVTTVCTSHMYY